MIKKTLAIICATVLLTACNNNDGNHSNKAKTNQDKTSVSAQQTISTEKQNPISGKISKDSQEVKVSYGIGYVMGTKLKERDINVNTDTFKAGFNAGLSGQQSKYSEQEAKKIMLDFQKYMIEKTKKAQDQKVMKIKEAVLKNQESLLHDKNTPTVGPKNAKVTVIELFDYQCAVCSKAYTTVKKVMESNPDTRFVFKDYPIFGSRWEASKYAAEVGLVAYQQGGEKLYIKYHNTIYATGKDEGKLQNSDINKIAKELGIKLSNSKNILKNTQLEDQLQENVKLAAQNLGIMFTPAFIIMPTQNANKSNTTIIPGYAPASFIEQAISKAKS